MKRFNKSVFFILAMMMLFQNAYAEEKVQEKTPGMKLTRGASNFVSSPLEYFVQFDRLRKDGLDPMSSLGGGLLFGTAMTAARLVTGAIEVVTFPFPVPEGYESIMDPPTAWDSFNYMAEGRQTV